MPDFVLTTCGTSILTNGADGETRAVMAATANHGDAEITAPQRVALEGLRMARASTLAAASLEVAAKVSAELNGILSHYGFAPSSEAKRQDVHGLLASDTFLGRMTRDLAADWLRQNGFEQVLALDIGGIKTSSLADFRVGTGELVTELQRLVSDYRESNFGVRFNLTGGFKSVNAFVQLLGLLWADEVFFVFEGSRELMRIPKLPVKLELENTVRENFATFRRLAILGSLPLADLADFPNGLLFVSDGDAGLSPWVEGAFAVERRRLFGEKVWEPWSKLVRFGPRFLGSTSELTPRQLQFINERIDDLGRYTLRGQTLKRLDLKALKGGSLDGSTHEADAWSEGRAARLFMHQDGGVWILDRLGDALH